MEFSKINKVAVLGLGVSGRACSKFLLSCGKIVFAFDQNFTSLENHPEVRCVIDQGLNFSNQDFLFVNVDFDLVILSPGIAFSHIWVEKALKKGFLVMGEVEFALHFIKNPIVAITGSNGKTTTTSLVTHVLNDNNLKAISLGNIGFSLSSYLMQQDTTNICVLELSSFQLETIYQRSFDVAMILNIQPNHLDRYESFNDYALAKLKIKELVKPEGVFLISKQVQNLFAIDATVFEEESFASQVENAAFAICKQFGITKEKFANSLQSFQKPPHRLEKILEIDGVTFINDSKASNIDAVIYALKQIFSPVVLIVGGKDKGSSYLPWIEAFQGRVKHLIAYGSSKDKIFQEIGHVFDVETFLPFEEAFNRAVSLAKKGDCVLLSPGCSSYDQFQNFEHRGNVFKQLVGKVNDGAKKNNTHSSDH